MLRQGFHAFALISILLLFTSCQTKPACPPVPDEVRYLSSLDAESIPSPTQAEVPSPLEVKISGRLMTVDRVVTGPLCKDTWKGTVYVACDVQVLQWEEEPLFLKGCNLSIEPGTVVYVAYHNDAPYYNGCSCHTGEEP